jgi:hypothetical protein
MPRLHRVDPERPLSSVPDGRLPSPGRQSVPKSRIPPRYASPATLEHPQLALQRNSLVLMNENKSLNPDRLMSRIQPWPSVPAQVVLSQPHKLALRATFCVSNSTPVRW